MWTDPIVKELHDWRTAHAAQFHQDLRAMVDDLRQLEQDWPAPKIAPPPILQESQTEVSCIPIHQCDEEKMK